MKTINLSLLLFISVCVSAQDLPYKIGNKILVVSGGGARGAWGVGVVDTLVKSRGGYKAVLGVSTGSTMGPLVLLQQFDLLTEIYTSTTQKDIFNKNPFKVKIQGDTVKTTPRLGMALRRLACGKATIGETKNFKKLIDKFFTKKHFDELRSRGLLLGVGVTNMTSGNFELKTSANNDYERMKNWIWASANQPLWMSYVHMDGSDYVDGGLRQVVPFEDAVRYAIDYDIDSIDVIINNSYDPILKGWEAKKDSWLAGLVRVLGVYGLGTHQYSLRVGKLLADINSCQDASQNTQSGNVQGNDGRNIHVIFYFMPDELAATYRDELGFDKNRMKALLLEGKKYFKPTNDLPSTNARMESSTKPAKKGMMEFNVTPKMMREKFLDK